MISSLVLVTSLCLGQAPGLEGTLALTENGDLSRKMLDGAHRFLERKIEESVKAREKLWSRDFSSRRAYEKSIAANRQRFRAMIGAIDTRLPSRMERFGEGDRPGLVAEAAEFRVYQVRWPVLEGVFGEGLLLEPRGTVKGQVVAIPDADETPEEVVGVAPPCRTLRDPQFARRLAASGFRVVVPTLVSRECDYSGNPKIAMTNQTHREWIYRQAYQMGRHVIGYEVQRVLAAVDWLADPEKNLKIGVAGYGEGALIAFYAAAIDPRIDATLVMGYFDAREHVWEEPIYRNVWGLLSEFGDAEIASLIAPRGLVVEACATPDVPGPPAVPKGYRPGAAVGKITTPAVTSVRNEWERFCSIVPATFHDRKLIDDSEPVARKFGSPAALEAMMKMLGVDDKLAAPGDAYLDNVRAGFDGGVRQERQVRELENHIQKLILTSGTTREQFLLNNTTLIKTLAPRGERFRMFRVKEQSPDVFAKEVAPYREILARDILGRIDDPVLPLNARTRKIYDRPKWTGYEVVLDVFPDVFAWGVLLVPKDIAAGERRPVVVCQHGRNGVPKDVIEGDLAAYHDFAARLADRGFITFAPHNLYKGEDLYRMLNRKGNPLKLSMFSFITAQHKQVLDWLGTLPFVDAKRIAFYGLSYGGETAVRVPPLLDGYCLSICSGDFNSWTRKVAATDTDYTFMITIEWEMPYFNMGSTFDYAELAYLMVPRPFMVERGHHDGVGLDSQVASEYAKVRWVYDNLGLSDRTAIEFFNGGHTINGQGTFEFLHRHLSWPKRE